MIHQINIYFSINYHLLIIIVICMTLCDLLDFFLHNDCQTDIRSLYVPQYTATE